MRRIILLCAMAIMVTGLSAQAQKKHTRPQDRLPPFVVQDVSMQDDSGGGYFIFNPATGAFKCILCEYGYALSGVGGVKVDGCNIYFSAVTDSYKMFVSVNVCDQQGKAAIEILRLPDSKFDIEPVLENWADSNMRDDTMECAATQADKQPADAPNLLPPPAQTQLKEFIVQNDEDGSYLVMNADTGAYKFIHCEDGAAMSGVGEWARATEYWHRSTSARWRAKPQSKSSRH